MENDDKKANQVGKSPKVNAEMERRMRLLANLIIDRIFEDKRNNVLKFQSVVKHKQNNAISVK